MRQLAVLREDQEYDAVLLQRAEKAAFVAVESGESAKRATTLALEELADLRGRIATEAKGRLDAKETVRRADLKIKASEREAQTAVNKAEEAAQKLVRARD
ncbi:hypothetical protein IAU60_002730 [Kwoniella sp. DSM 27419]